MKKFTLNRNFYLIGLLLLLGACKATKTTDSKVDLNDGKNTEKKPTWVSKANNYPYQSSRQRIHDLIHTKLEVDFDWQKQYMNGVATLTLKPYFYPQSTLILDAKGFDIKEVKTIDGVPLKYIYEADEEARFNTKLPQYPTKLIIDLDREYSRDEEFKIIIEYVAKPNELLEGGSDAITGDKGLYFINPLGEEEGKPKQIWTQGETEASSCWFPTIDAPNEKTTQEIYITVDAAFVTLSNGRLVSSTFSADNSKRTDYWKMDLPHAPYLFMMAIGDFAKIEDKWRDKQVNYYVEKEYEPYAKLVFGNTPEMMEFFSNKLGYDYPWPKYSQIAVRDYVSGAMENTSASIFLEQIQLDNREVLDKNWDYIIAHELFHHWFGDLTTCESWSNLALNESFANYSEYLWMEHKYGRDEADHHAENELIEYLDEAVRKQEPIVRYHYDYRDDMFDRHSYNKGGRVLHMLRKYVGDDAFFESLKLFLKTNEFQPVEIHHLRLAFEKVTGEDLNWFFNQWFLSPGHPELDVTYHITESKVQISVQQLQDLRYSPLFKIPFVVDYWIDDKKESIKFILDSAKQSFEFAVSKRPELVLFDGDQMILGEVNDHKSDKDFMKQYALTNLYLSRKEALQGITTWPKDTVETTEGTQIKVKPNGLSYNPKLKDQQIRNILSEALNDRYYIIRALSIDSLVGYRGTGLKAITDKVIDLAKTDSTALVRSKAIYFLSQLESQSELIPLYKHSLNDSAYSVVSAALVAYLDAGATDAEEKVLELRDIDNDNIAKSVAQFYIKNKIGGHYDWFTQKFEDGDPIVKLRFAEFYAQYLFIETDKQKQGIKVLEEIARNHDNLYARFGGYKGLWILKSIVGVDDIRKSIREGEKNKRLQSAFDRLENR